jgi:tetratricopeptide (TPR) repeat protein
MNAAEHLARAERALQRRDLGLAAELFEAALECHRETRVGATIGMARIAILLRRSDDAAMLLDGVLKSNPASAAALTLRGVVDEATGDLPRALERYREALSTNPESTIARVNLGRAFAQLEEWSRAAEVLRELVSPIPGKNSHVVMFAIAAHRAGASNDAIRALTETVRRDPANAEASATLVDILADSGRVELAKRLLENAATRLPHEPSLISRQAALALRLGETANARGFADTWLAERPLDEDALLFGALMDLLHTDLARAESRTLKLLEVNPRHAKAHHQLGGIYDACKLREAAKVAYQTASALDPDAWEPLNDFANLCLLEEDQESILRARTALERAMSVAPPRERDTVRYNLAVTSIRLNDARTCRALAQEVVASEHAAEGLVRDARRMLATLDA